MANKSDVIKAYEKASGLKGAEAERQVNGVLEALVSVIGKESANEPNGKKQIRGKLTIVGFGVFTIRAVPERKHPNPQEPGKSVVKPPHNRVDFDPGSAIDAYIN
jgi:nucleoid DNA-binding protein